MKFVLVLIILLKTSATPDMYTWTSFNFIDLETCEAFLNAKIDYLNSSVQRQFNKDNNVAQFDYMCVSKDDYDQYIKQKLGV